MSDRVRSWWRVPVVVAGSLAAAAGVLLLTVGGVPALQGLQPWLTVVAVFVPYGVLAWLVAGSAAVALPRRGRRWAAAVVVVALAVQVWLARPYWPRTPAPASGTEVVVMTANLYYGRARVPELVDAVTRAAPDVLVVQEATVPILGRLEATALAAELPHRLSQGATAWGPEGAAVFSRFPLTVLRAPAARGAQFVLRVDRPGAPFALVAVHTTNPLVDLPSWRAQLGEVAAVAATVEGPLVVAGDFNATREHDELQRLLATGGLADAADLAGSGWLPTFPAASGWVPLVGLDHVLVSGGVGARWVRTVPIAGADHRAVVAAVVA